MSSHNAGIGAGDGTGEHSQRVGLPTAALDRRFTARKWPGPAPISARQVHGAD